ncbi:acetyltransferase sphE [Aspergillus clavatus NRRL 1]|uniref:LysR family regulatory protein, putative n=1 Tax=Aspergillus clavatus (strain ATCC 1007 / CBS 513.65 / DSM 816 / NCTC 3887 / NRRL 1 / QM 1276 / 107) TaxID=344612 RepID=A1C8J1_ASPCL|nr:LysR family regulatory protein, putative [Aspergillus clavatus NRRL 1]EAW13628.1 LysR family regulatory protein, putative [Aspergillus clavatus NRRL 1]
MRPQKKIPPPTVPTDTIIPFHYWDDDHHTRGLSFDVTFRFDDVLDPQKLRRALSRLLELGNWRKLGARTRRNAEGGLEYHVPQCFDDKRPGFVYSTDTYDMKMADHSQASRLADAHHLDAAGRPAVLDVTYTAAPEFRSFIRTAGFPDRLEDWLCSDSPQLGIRVIVFQDATLVTVSFLHSLMDMMGLNAFLDAWTAVLRGHEDEVKPFEGFLEDPLANLSGMKTAPVQKYVFADILLIGWTWFLFALRYVFTVELFWKHREEERLIFLPTKHLQRMRKAAMAELASQHTSDSNKPPFVSEGDILFAWWTRVVLRAEKPRSGRTVNMRNTYCCRSILAQLGHIPSAASALVTNAVFATLTFLSVRQILEEPLSVTALEVRKSLIQQRNAKQLQALDAIQRDTLDNAHHPALFGDPGMYNMMISNWVKARLFEVDFSAAVVREGTPRDKRSNAVGRPSSVQGTGTKGYATRNTGVVIGKDAVGNCWLLYTLGKGAWPAVEQQLRSMSDE